jgi:hypothetical protein
MQVNRLLETFDPFELEIIIAPLCRSVGLVDFGSALTKNTTSLAAQSGSHELLGQYFT